MPESPLHEKQLFFPSPTAVKGIAGFLAGFGIATITLAFGTLLFFRWMNGVQPWWPAYLCVFGIIAVSGVFLLGSGLHFCRLGRHPLVVELDGQVTYRKKEVAPAGAARELIIRRDVVGDESGPTEIFRLFIRNVKGVEIELPTPYFSVCGTCAEVESLAARLADALHISVRNQHGFMEDEE